MASFPPPHITGQTMEVLYDDVLFICLWAQALRGIIPTWNSGVYYKSYATGSSISLAPANYHNRSWCFSQRVPGPLEIWWFSWKLFGSLGPSSGEGPSNGQTLIANVCINPSKISDSGWTKNLANCRPLRPHELSWLIQVSTQLRIHFKKIIKAPTPKFRKCCQHSKSCFRVIWK